MLLWPSNREKASMGSGFLLNWTRKYIFCRCLEAALCTLQKTIGPRSESKSVIKLGFPTPSLLLFNPQLSKVGTGMSQLALLKIRSPWTDHSGGSTPGQNWISKKLCLLLAKEQDFSWNTHTQSRVHHAHTHRQPQGIFIFSNLNPESDTAAKWVPLTAPPTQWDTGAANCAPQSF